MKSFLVPGDFVELAAPSGGVASGEFAVVGKLYGVATNAAAEGVIVPFKRRGVFNLPKATGASWSQGDQLYWDGSAKKFTKTAAGNKEVGVAWADAASNDATGAVAIDPGASLTVAGG